MFGISRQSIYQAENRAIKRNNELRIVRCLVEQVRIEMPRLGTRKLYYLLKDELINSGVKLGRDGLFSYLRKEQLLIRPRKSYTKTTHSKHWLKKHPNLYNRSEVKEPENAL